MDNHTVQAFLDELEKIGIALPSLKHMKYPLAAGGGILGWEQLKKLKRRYEIGKQFEEQMAARGQ